MRWHINVWQHLVLSIPDISSTELQHGLSASFGCWKDDSLWVFRRVLLLWDFLRYAAYLVEGIDLSSSACFLLLCDLVFSVLPYSPNTSFNIFSALSFAFCVTREGTGGNTTTCFKNLSFHTLQHLLTVKYCNCQDGRLSSVLQGSASIGVLEL